MPLPSKIVLIPSSQNGVRDFLENKGFQFSSQDHTFWHAQSGGLHIIFYKSGSVVLQGNSGQCEKWIELLRPFQKGNGTVSPGGSGKKGHLLRNGAVLGLDESGKGDYFGPLVLAGAVVSDKDMDMVMKAGVADSKKLTDNTIGRIFRELSGKMVYRVRVIEPAEYNRLYNHHKNLNRLMMDEYRKLIESFKEKEYDRIILDKFSSSDRQNGELQRSLKKEITIVVRAEENPSVALASIIARYYFVEWINTRSEKYGLDIPIGSGPLAGDLFRRLKNSKDHEKFLAIAKAHFKSGPDTPDALF